MHMDAQQRLLLERSWEVLQLGPQQNVSSVGPTSVFVGIGTVEYTAMASHLGIGIHMATGQSNFTLALGIPEAQSIPGLAMQCLQLLLIVSTNQLLLIVSTKHLHFDRSWSAWRSSKHLIKPFIKCSGWSSCYITYHPECFPFIPASNHMNQSYSLCWHQGSP